MAPRSVAQTVELALIHLAACRYRQQGLVCSQCQQAERRAAHGLHPAA